MQTKPWLSDSLPTPSRIRTALWCALLATAACGGDGSQPSSNNLEGALTTEAFPVLSTNPFSNSTRLDVPECTGEVLAAVDAFHANGSVPESFASFKLVASRRDAWDPRYVDITAESCGGLKACVVKTDRERQLVLSSTKADQESVCPQPNSAQYQLDTTKIPYGIDILAFENPSSHATAFRLDPPHEKNEVSRALPIYKCDDKTLLSEYRPAQYPDLGVYDVRTTASEVLLRMVFAAEEYEYSFVACLDEDKPFPNSHTLAVNLFQRANLDKPVEDAVSALELGGLDNGPDLDTWIVSKTMRVNVEGK